MALRISSKLHQELLRLATASPKAEVCGLLIGDAEIDRIVPAKNVAPDPTLNFEIDPVTLFAAIRAERTGQGRLLGYYHSHPNGRPTPSCRDAELAVADGKVWIIIGGSEITAWLPDNRRQFNKIVLEFTD